MLTERVLRISGSVLKWLIPVHTGRFCERGTGAVLDLLLCGGYRARERLLWLFVRRLVLREEVLTRDAPSLADSGSKEGCALRNDYNVLIVEVRAHGSFSNRCTELLQGIFSEVMMETA